MIFLGIKYEPLSDPPSLKFVSGAPGGPYFVHQIFKIRDTLSILAIKIELYAISSVRHRNCECLPTHEEVEIMI